MTDYSTQQHFNEEVQKTLAKLAPSAVGLGYLRNAYNFFEPKSYPYNPNQLPGSGPITGQRALPAPGQTSLRGWTMGEGSYRSPNFPFHRDGGAYGNVPQHGRPQGPDDGTYYQGGYFGAGGSYNPTSVDYGDMLPQFAMGYNIPEAMYGMGMAEGGTPCYNCGGMYQDGGSPLYSTQGQTLRNFTNTAAFTPNQGWDPSHIMMPPVGFSSDVFAKGGVVKGGEYEMSEQEIQDLIKKGYKIQYV